MVIKNRNHMEIELISGQKKEYFHGNRKQARGKIPTVPREKRQSASDLDEVPTCYDPTELTEEINRIVLHNGQRKYYRLARAGRWYGGIATADCCGCNLRCHFCWSGKPRDNVNSIGEFHGAFEVAQALLITAEKHRYGLVRISGNEPTLGRNHLLQVIHAVEAAGLAFILETNGLLLDLSLAKSLSAHSNLHVRVSLKGTDPGEFTRLTGACPEYFNDQLKALENLLVSGVSCHPAVMVSFSPPEKIKHLRETLQMIHPDLERDLEEETVILYPHVVKRLKAAGLNPLEA
jgi:uncharacterized Fe-S cluster-containing radical SAM superfamily protein